jgi:hypothetical protein
MSSGSPSTSVDVSCAQLAHGADMHNSAASATARHQPPSSNAFVTRFPRLRLALTSWLRTRQVILDRPASPIREAPARFPRASSLPGDDGGIPPTCPFLIVTFAAPLSCGFRRAAAASRRACAPGNRCGSIVCANRDAPPVVPDRASGGDDRSRLWHREHSGLFLGSA